MGFFACEILGRALAARGLVQVFLQPAALKNDAATANPDAGVLDLAAGHEVAERARRNREIRRGFGQGHHCRRRPTNVSNALVRLAVLVSGAGHNDRQ